MRIRISAIGVDSALIALGLAADGTLTLQVPVDGSVAGWFTGSPTPGEHGPAVIAAHVDWNHAPGVFFHLRDLEPGAEVAVDRADGTTARFEVLKVEQYPKDAFPTERVYGDIDHAGLRLIPCGARSTGAPAATATTWWSTRASSGRPAGFSCLIEQPPFTSCSAGRGRQDVAWCVGRAV